MLRVGLTGNLGSGKSTAALLLSQLGAHVLASDAIGRELMQPGQKVYDQIVARFGSSVVMSDGTLDRPALARIAFEGGRAEELNAIVHPAVVEREAVLARELSGKDPEGIVVVESALIFETKYAAGGDGKRGRFDRIILVTAPQAEKVARFVRRQTHNQVVSAAESQRLETEARRRLLLQIPDEAKIQECDYVLSNNGSLDHLAAQVEALWGQLLEAQSGMRAQGENAPESLQ